MVSTTPAGSFVLRFLDRWDDTPQRFLEALRVHQIIRDLNRLYTLYVSSKCIYIYTYIHTCILLQTDFHHLDHPHRTHCAPGAVLDISNYLWTVHTYSRIVLMAFYALARGGEICAPKWPTCVPLPLYVCM